MGLKACKQCSKEVSTDAKRCPQCGAKRPTGGVSFLAGCLTIFVVLIVIGSLVPGSPSTEQRPSGPESVTEASTPFTPVKYTIVTNTGSGSVRRMSVLIAPDDATPELGQLLGETLRREMSRPTHAYVMVYKSERAAKLLPRVSELTAAEERHYDANYIGDYTKNTTTGMHEFTYFPSGLNGPKQTFKY
jgi:hypothetical protein